MTQQQRPSRMVQISEELFLDLCRVVIGGIDSPATVDRAVRGLREKLDRMVARELYTTMHDTTKRPQEREEARQAYLDSRGIHPSFRWGGGDSHDSDI